MSLCIWHTLLFIWHRLSILNDHCSVDIDRSSIDYITRGMSLFIWHPLLFNWHTSPIHDGPYPVDIDRFWIDYTTRSMSVFIWHTLLFIWHRSSIHDDHVSVDVNRFWIDRITRSMLLDISYYSVDIIAYTRWSLFNTLVLIVGLTNSREQIVPEFLPSEFQPRLGPLRWLMWQSQANRQKAYGCREHLNTYGKSEIKNQSIDIDRLHTVFTIQLT